MREDHPSPVLTALHKAIIVTPTLWIIERQQDPCHRWILIMATSHLRTHTPNLLLRARARTIIFIMVRLIIHQFNHIMVLRRWLCIHHLRTP